MGLKVNDLTANMDGFFVLLIQNQGLADLTWFWKNKDT
jgi:hypothetical protein